MSLRQNNQPRTKQIFLYFKNLFTLSGAIFIFIGDETLFNLGHKDQFGLKRGVEYTYFSSRYFIGRPLWEDLNRYLSKLSQLSEPNINTERFFRSICFDASNDYFELIRVIRDKITNYSDNSEPIITDINDSDVIKKARLHKAITILFEDKYRSKELSKWAENEKLLIDLFHDSHNLYHSNPGAELHDPEHDDLPSALIRDFHHLLNRLSILEFVQGSKKKIKTEYHFKFASKYRYSGSYPVEPPDFLDFPTEYEQEYVNTFRYLFEFGFYIFKGIQKYKNEPAPSFKEYLFQFHDYYQDLLKWGIDLLPTYKIDYEIIKNIQEERPHDYLREDVINRTKSLATEISNMEYAFPKAYSVIIEDKLNINTLKISSLANNDQLFNIETGPIRKLVKRGNIPNTYIVHKEDLSRQVILINEHITPEIEKIKVADKNTHQAIYFSKKAKTKLLNGVYLVRIDNPENLEEATFKLLTDMEKFFNE